MSNELVLLVSDYPQGTAGFHEWLMRFHVEELRFPLRKTYYPNEEYTGWHSKEVFQRDYRER